MDRLSGLLASLACLFFSALCACCCCERRGSFEIKGCQNIMLRAVLNADASIHGGFSLGIVRPESRLIKINSHISF